MPSVIYYNGKLYKNGRPVISLCDRAVFFGDAVYDAAIGRGQRIYLGEEHFERLLCNARALDIPAPYTIEKLREITENLLKKARLKEFFLYIQLSRSAEERAHAYPREQGSNLLITLSRFSVKPRETRLKLITAEDKRYGYCNIKTVNLLPAVLASKAAESLGCDEAVFHRGETVTECAHSNVAILKDGRLITHPDCNLILPGITKRRLISAAETLGIEVCERPFTLDELFSSDEVIITSTTKLCLAACEIDGKRVGGGDGKRLALLQEEMFSEYAFWTM